MSTTEQAPGVISEVRRLLIEREAKQKEVAAIDERILFLVGAKMERRPTNRKSISKATTRAALGAP